MQYCFNVSWILRLSNRLHSSGQTTNLSVSLRYIRFACISPLCSCFHVSGLGFLFVSFCLICNALLSQLCYAMLLFYSLILCAPFSSLVTSLVTSKLFCYLIMLLFVLLSSFVLLFYFVLLSIIKTNEQLWFVLLLLCFLKQSLFLFFYYSMFFDLFCFLLLTPIWGWGWNWNVEITFMLDQWFII